MTKALVDQTSGKMAARAIQTELADECLLCGRCGLVLHTGLRDWLFGVPGSWTLVRCPADGLVWLNPRPTIQDIGKTYATYYTHSKSGRSARVVLLPDRLQAAMLQAVFGYEDVPRSLVLRLVAAALGHVPLLRDVVGSTVMWLPRASTGKLLDVGCGSGEFLAKMRSLDWDVTGVETDPQAAKAARDGYDIPVLVGTLEAAGFDDATFDVVTLSHVVEHVHDVIALLVECRRVLRPGGKLVILTPNVGGLGHKVLGTEWRGLEPPRHLHLFSVRTLVKCAERAGLEIQSARSTSRSARAWWHATRRIQFNRDSNRSTTQSERLIRRLRLGFERFAFQIIEEVVFLFTRNVGEEVLLTATKRRAAESG